MAQHNVVIHNEHLFARKGEAAPVGREPSDFAHGGVSQFPRNGKKTRKSKERDSSPLSGLIQRRACSPDVSDDAEKIVVPEAKVFASWRKLKSRLEAPRKPEEDVKWKKLTFRVRHEQYLRLKTLSGLWGTTNQSILEKAVAYYIDEATTSGNLESKG